MTVTSVSVTMTFMCLMCVTMVLGMGVSVTNDGLYVVVVNAFLFQGEILAV